MAAPCASATPRPGPRRRGSREDVLGGKTWLADIGDATHYHANYVRPRWARSLKKIDVIGRHIFYRLKSG